MFTQRVNNVTNLTGPVADAAFSDITSDQLFIDDNSFLVTARTLLIPRKGKLAIRYWKCDEEDIAEFTKNIDSDRLIILDTGGKDKADTPEVGKLPQGFRFLELTSERVSKLCNCDGSSNVAEKRVRIYVNEAEQKSIVAVSAVGTMIAWHAIQSAFPTYVPWLFRQELTEEEVRMLLALADPKKSTKDYTNAVEKLSAGIDLQLETKRYYLKEFERLASTRLIDVLERGLTDCIREIQGYVEKLSDLYNKKADYDTELFALKNVPTDDRHELMDYFLQNQKLYLEDCCDGTLHYVVGGYCDNWNPDNFELCFDNKDSVIFTTFRETRSEAVESESDFETLLAGLFVTEKIKLKMVSAWELGYGSGISAVRKATYPPRFKDYLPNPHLNYYACTGGFRADLEKATGECNYVMAVDITSYENGNINWMDSFVVPLFVKDLITTKKKCFELPDGTAVTNTEAVAWLKERES